MKLTLTAAQLRLLSQTAQAALASQTVQAGLSSQTTQPTLSGIERDTGRYPFKQERLTASEALAYAFAKGLTEEQFTADLAALLVERGVSDAASAADIASWAVELVKSEAFGIAETQAWVMQQSLSDSVTAVEGFGYGLDTERADAAEMADERVLGVPVDESNTATDSQDMAFAKELADGVVPTDFMLGFSFNGAAADSAITDDFSEADDDLAWEIGRTESEPVSVVDLLGYLLGRSNDDVVTVGDLFDLGLDYAEVAAVVADALAPFNITLRPNEPLVFAESLARNLTRAAITEATTAASAGWLVQQDYVDNTYWREDFTTGLYRTFT